MEICRNEENSTKMYESRMKIYKSNNNESFEFEDLQVWF